MRERLLLLLPLMSACALPVYASGARPTHPVMLAAIEQTPCFGRCPVYRASVWTDGRVEIEGRAHVPEIGRVELTVSADALRAIEAAITEANVRAMAASYERHFITDLPTTITTVRVSDGELREVRRYHGDRSAPERLVQLEGELTRLMGVDEWLGSHAQISLGGAAILPWFVFHRCHLHPGWSPHVHDRDGRPCDPTVYHDRWERDGRGHGNGHDDHAHGRGGRGRDRDEHGRDDDELAHDDGERGRVVIVSGEDGRPVPSAAHVAVPQVPVSTMLPRPDGLTPRAGDDGRARPSAADGAEIRVPHRVLPERDATDRAPTMDRAPERTPTIDRTPVATPRPTLPLVPGRGAERTPTVGRSPADRAPSSARTPVATPRPALPTPAPAAVPARPSIDRGPSGWAPARVPTTGDARPHAPPAPRPSSAPSPRASSAPTPARGGTALTLPSPSPSATANNARVDREAKKGELRPMPRKSLGSPVIGR